jgi:hypothetical protein
VVNFMSIQVHSNMFAHDCDGIGRAVPSRDDFVRLLVVRRSVFIASCSFPELFSFLLLGLARAGWCSRSMFPPLVLASL